MTMRIPFNPYGRLFNEQKTGQAGKFTQKKEEWASENVEAT
jgi:hypothetical protein